MKISGLQKLSLVDYDGHIACTIFTPGCNFACPFCHNSSLVTNIQNIDEITKEDVYEHLRKRAGIIDSIVVSGGEPTLQPDLVDFIKELRKFPISIKLDTNGTNLPILKELVEDNLIDYVAMDIKNSMEKYPQTIDRDIEISIIKETIDYIMTCGIDYEFRTTLVKNFHTENDIENIGKLLSGAKKYCLQRFVDNDNCIRKGLTDIPKSEAEKLQEVAKKYIPNTILRGY